MGVLIEEQGAAARAAAAASKLPAWTAEAQPPMASSGSSAAVSDPPTAEQLQQLRRWTMAQRGGRHGFEPAYPRNLQRIRSLLTACCRRVAGGATAAGSSCGAPGMLPDVSPPQPSPTPRWRSGSRKYQRRSRDAWGTNLLPWEIGAARQPMRFPKHLDRPHN